MDELMATYVVPKLRFNGFNDEWHVRSLAEVGSITTGSTPPTNEPAYYDGEFMFVAPGDLDKERYVTRTEKTLTAEGLERSRRLQPGSVLFTCIGAIGKVGQASKECCTNQQINAVTAKDGFSNDFIFSLLQQHGPAISLHAGTQVLPMLSKSEFSKLRFRFPTLPEQQKIAAFLGAVDRKIQQLKRKQALLEQYKKGVVQQLFSQELRFKREDGSEYPEWEERTLGEVITRTATGLNPRKNFKLGTGDNYYVTIKNIKNGTLDFSTCEKIDDEAMALIRNRSDLRKGDLIMASIGNVGDAYLLEEEPVNWNINESVFALRPSKAVVPRYLFYVLTSDASKAYLESNSTGSSFKSIKLTELRLLPVPLPSLEEQTRIAGFLMALDAKVAGVARAVEAAQRWKKGLLQQMFV